MLLAVMSVIIIAQVYVHRFSSKYLVQQKKRLLRFSRIHSSLVYFRPASFEAATGTLSSFVNLSTLVES